MRKASQPVCKSEHWTNSRARLEGAVSICAFASMLTRVRSLHRERFLISRLFLEKYGQIVLGLSIAQLRHLSLVKQAWNGKMDAVIETTDQNVRLV